MSISYFVRSSSKCASPYSFNNRSSILELSAVNKKISELLTNIKERLLVCKGTEKELPLINDQQLLLADKYQVTLLLFHKYEVSDNFSISDLNEVNENIQELLITNKKHLLGSESMGKEFPLNRKLCREQKDLLAAQKRINSLIQSRLLVHVNSPKDEEENRFDEKPLSIELVPSDENSSVVNSFPLPNIQIITNEGAQPTEEKPKALSIELVPSDESSSIVTSSPIPNMQIISSGNTQPTEGKQNTSDKDVKIVKAGVEDKGIISKIFSYQLRLFQLMQCWPTWKKVGFIGLSILAVGAIIYWWPKTNKALARYTPSIPKTLSTAATSTPSKVLGAATATVSTAVSTVTSTTEQLKNAYWAAHDTVRYQLKEMGRSLNWCVRHKYITQELKDWIVSNGKLKKYWEK